MSILINYRGVPNESTQMGKTDFVVMFGDITIDTDRIKQMIKRRGPDMAYLSARLNQAFDTFSNNRINNLFIRLPEDETDAQENLFVCFQILARYEPARKTNSPVFFFRKGARLFCPIIFNEMNRSDLNLTLLAGLNNLKPEFVHALVQKVDEWMQKNIDNIAPSQTLNVFSILFAIKNFKEKLLQPPIEVNNIQLLMQEKGKEEITRDRAKVTRLVADSFGESPLKTARVLHSVYGDDYKTISSHDLGERLGLASELLATIEEKPASEGIGLEVIKNIEMRLDVVNDDVFDDIFLVGSSLKTIVSGKEKNLSDKIHFKIIQLVNFFKARVKINNKMKSILKGAIDFNAQDLETLARDLGITIEAAKNLINILKECFDDEGRFKRPVFEQNIPEFAKYEKKVFEFLLHYLKETVNRNDRVAFLNALQLLISRLRQPLKAITILFDDFLKEPEVISFSDRNSIMLSNLLLRKYNKELKIDIEITPEEVLLVREGLSKEVVEFADDYIKSNRGKFIDKIRNIHRNLVSALDPSQEDEEKMPIRYLFSLEREIYIFLSLVGGATAVSVIKSALKEYGNPDSDIYRLPASRKNITIILQLLKVLIRGMGRNGIANDIPLIEEVKSKEQQFLSFAKSNVFVENIGRIMEWADKVKKDMRQRKGY
jgi:hypothetical protein